MTDPDLHALLRDVVDEPRRLTTTAAIVLATAVSLDPVGRLRVAGGDVVSKILTAVALALALAASRLIADVVIPPHMQWWFTPLIALQTSLVTSVYWLCWHRSPRKAVGGAR